MNIFLYDIPKATSMETRTRIGPIAIEASRTRWHLEQIHANAEKYVGASRSGLDLDVQLLNDCLSRFKVWITSLGVFQEGEASLDSRISNEDLSKEVLRLLKQIDYFASELQPIIQGDRAQRVWLPQSLQVSPDEFLEDGENISDDEDYDEDPPTPGSDYDADWDITMTESKDLSLSINDSVMSLLRLSIVIQNSTKRAKFAKSSTAEYYDIGPDVTHVRDFFPFAAEKELLVHKLGQANAQRRQWLWYRRRHREKMSLDLSGECAERIHWDENIEPSNIGSMARGSTVDNDYSANLPSLSGTKASTFHPELAIGVGLASNLEYPETFYGKSSRAVGEEAAMMVPEMPQTLTVKEPFMCPYCCNIVEVSSKSAWQKHVHSDLSSYTCVFHDCNELLFESRHKWWAHELELHRKKWVCDLCGVNLPSLSATKEHLSATHRDLIDVENIDDILPRFGRPVTHLPASDCPLCDYPALLRLRGYASEDCVSVPADNLGKHIGRHLEQLALFVLPQAGVTYEEEDESDKGSIDIAFETDMANDVHKSASTLLSEPDLTLKLSQEVSRELWRPDILAKPPDLALRWQPPHDFTPPEEDFDTVDADLLPTRQDPIFGGDLHTPGWARGFGRNKEGFCARCPVSHWVNIPDGNYAFHLTYFHGVPDSGIPLPRPSAIRPAQGSIGAWEGYCEACDKWKALKKTKRGWNWYRHWLNDHSDIVLNKAEAFKQGASLDQVLIDRCPDSSTKSQIPIGDLNELDAFFVSHLELLDDTDWIQTHLVLLVTSDEFEAAEHLLRQLVNRGDAKFRQSIANSVAKTGKNVLMISASQGQGGTVDLLLEMGANPNGERTGDKTALDLASDAGYFSISKKLLAAGADVSKSHIFRKIFSNEREYAGECTEAVNHPTQPSELDSTLLKPLCRAAYEGNVQEVKRLLSNNSQNLRRCDTEEGAEMGVTAFILASSTNKRDVMQLLLTHGANINATSKHGWTPLMLAAKRNDQSCTEFLLSHGADVNHLSPDQWVALAEATSRGFIRIMRMLLNAGADPEIRSQHDWTPLMHAAYRGDTEAVNLLLAAGASFDDISARDETVMLLAAAGGSVAVVKILLDAGCPPEPKWSKVALIPEENIGEGQHSSQQGRIERVYQVGWTPLMVACQIGNQEIVSLLLDAGANTKPKSPLFKTALEIARENARNELVEYLVTRLGSRDTTEEASSPEQ